MNHYVHRAGGLWLCLLLLPVTVSSEGMNSPEQMCKPVLSLGSKMGPGVYAARGRLPAELSRSTAYDFSPVYDYSAQHAADLGLREHTGELYYSFASYFYGSGFGDH